jgi:hypothetical protein
MHFLRCMKFEKCLLRFTLEYVCYVMFAVYTPNHLNIKIHSSDYYLYGCETWVFARNQGF